MWAIVVLLLPPVVLLGVSLRVLYLTLAPIWFVFKHDYEGLERVSRNTLASWLRWLPSLRPAARYNLAFAMHMRGEFAQAIDTLHRELQRPMSRRLRYAAMTLLAGTLVLSGREPSVARDLLCRALKVNATPNDYLTLAHAEFDLGHLEDAEQAFDRATTLAEDWTVWLGFITILFRHRQLERDLFNLLSGWYLSKSKRLDRAREALCGSLSLPGSNLYRERARELLATIEVTEQGTRAES